MSQGPLCPNLTQKVQKEVSQMSNRNFPLVMLLGGLSVNLNHLKMRETNITNSLRSLLGAIENFSLHAKPGIY